MPGEENKTGTEMWRQLVPHRDHDVIITTYGPGNGAVVYKVCLECETCGEVLLDAELYTFSRNGERQAEDALWNLLLENWNKRTRLVHKLDGDVKLAAGRKTLLDTGTDELAARGQPTVTDISGGVPVN